MPLHYWFRTVGSLSLSEAIRLRGWLILRRRVRGLFKDELNI